MTRTAIHPGEQLAKHLFDLGMSAAELGRQLKVPANRITEILNKQRAITGDTALRLGHFFGTSAEYWLNLQATYELRLAEQKSGADIREPPDAANAQEEARQSSNGDGMRRRFAHEPIAAKDPCGTAIQRVLRPNRRTKLKQGECA
jgi:addiction module HigA family antidote